MKTAKLSAIKKFLQKSMPHNGHNFSHVDRVRKNALKFAECLKISDKLDLNLLQAICYLHDVTYIEYKGTIYPHIFESVLVKKELLKILPKFKINDQEAQVIIKACIKHPHSFPYKRLNYEMDFYTRLLQDADTVDYFHEERLQMVKENINKVPFLGKYIFFFIHRAFLSGKKKLPQYLNFPELYEKTQL
ncbi:hypothetical protein A2X44_04560 [candidate division CPR3 bacterium GWF2_35_18]|uniref:HD domain-containing protein n=1 Tax=candidate division CPR3 bacterium GW2011_GWF2_35_18 TaxID=1618350 RepID=A0A0G0E2H4_UNCC3|nr:MAG: hypothetical protein UR67_C0007G0100 [candidate division CPR3 bacterium GW2011_GWF2_35_18]KKP85243.1 MAG: hypothetical protein UR87_C0057G0005 [candidate division CPR3 bacterium GW2011_GWE2_35_7]OGB62624.1 MAG: hypothetical protein A2X44_04560 [candidate division CPR3 bacterium GWF2_35_18]OGB65874.1 MAG: hypothetical protein A2250_01810 [candidate division CPR3 bacterium RIFOXYA2_FULL_35_13]OGB78850.1 MAG: hypothetical protein A2296_05320 [candidate division CPR3 bacterium RIFOXYB2_FULL